MTKLLANKKFKFALGIILAFLLVVTLIPAIHTAYGCLLYTSDAADE